MEEDSGTDTKIIIDIEMDLTGGILVKSLFYAYGTYGKFFISGTLLERIGFFCGT